MPYYPNAGNKPYVGEAGRTAVHFMDKIGFQNGRLRLGATSVSDLSVKGANIKLGAHRTTAFTYDLNGITGATTTFTADDVLVELGVFDTTTPSGYTPTLIFIKRVTINKKVATSTAMAVNLAASDTAGTAVNAASATNTTEFMGLNAETISGTTSADSGANEIDAVFGTAGVHVFTPNISFAVARKNIYLRTTTALSAALTAGSGNIVIDYMLI